MSKKKIRDLTTLSAADDLDLLAIVDVDEPILENQTKKITVSTLLDGLGDTRLPVGQDGQLLSANSASIDGTGLEWINAPTGGDEPYVGINSTGTQPIANGADSVVIGVSAKAHTPGTNAIVIGNNARVTDDNQFFFSDDSIAIGTNSRTEASNSVSIGSNCEIAGPGTIYGAVAIGSGTIIEASDSLCMGFNSRVESSSSICIGTNARVEASSTNSISIGKNSRASDSGSIAIGSGSNSSSEGAIQLGTGTNTSPDSLQFKNNRLANNEGLYTSFVNPSNYTPSNVDNVTSHFQAIDQALGNSADTGEPYIEINSDGNLPNVIADDGIAIGESTTVFDLNAIALGKGAQTGDGDVLDATDSIAIGKFSRTAANNSSVGAIAIGVNSQGDSNNAVALGSNATAEAVNSIQLGSGSNAQANTIQYLDNAICSDKGLITNVINSNPSGIYLAGSLVIREDIKTFDYFSDGEWKSLTPFVGVNSTGSLPIARRQGSIAIGENAINGYVGTYISQIGGITIGSNSQGGTGITIGRNAFANGGSTDGIVIGNNAKLSSSGGASPGAIAIGLNANVATSGTGSDFSIAIGQDSFVGRGLSSVAIGKGAEVEWDLQIHGTTPLENCVQIGQGVNQKSNTFNYLTNTIATADGLFVAETSGVPASILESGTPRWDPNSATLYISNGSVWKSVVLN